MSSYDSSRENFFQDNATAKNYTRVCGSVKGVLEGIYALPALVELVCIVDFGFRVARLGIHSISLGK